jgi:DNA-binding LacI/PurR family transcriptional regulator
MIPQIAIAPSAPFVTAQKFAELAGMPVATVKNKIQRGEFPIRKKTVRRVKPAEKRL